jgi:hypothetical protein
VIGERDQTQDRLDGRAGRVGAAQRAVEQRLLDIVVERRQFTAR